MEPATIMVIVLMAGVAALLVWFEVNSRRNEARKKQGSTLTPSTLDALQKDSPGKAESETEKRKAA